MQIKYPEGALIQLLYMSTTSLSETLNFSRNVEITLDSELIAIEDVIGLEDASNRTDCILHYIKDHPFPNHKLTKEVLSFNTDKKTFSDIQTEVKDRIQKSN